MSQKRKMKKQDDSLWHAKDSDSAYYLESHTGKHTKTPDSAYSLENQDDSGLKNQDVSEENLKDSAYSNSFRNSQSRESDSSKSTCCRSHFSGSSGYGRNKSVGGNKTVPLCAASRKRIAEDSALLERKSPETVPKEKRKKDDVDIIQWPPVSMVAGSEYQNTVGLDKEPDEEVEFSCIITMNDGVVRHMRPNILPSFEFPEKIWIGRCFTEFVHPLDKDAFISQITKNRGCKTTADDAATPAHKFKMACRLRKYQNTNLGFVVRDNVSYFPFVLNFTVLNIKLPAGLLSYSIITATSLNTAYKSPDEVMFRSVPFLIRHAASGAFEHIDVESVPYLGYMPHEIHNKNAISMYHPKDLPELKIVYECIVKGGVWAKPLIFRLKAHNGDYVTILSVWTGFTNPGSMKLEFIISKNTVLVGPATSDVFMMPPLPQNRYEAVMLKTTGAYTQEEDILKIRRDEPGVVMVGRISQHHEYSESVSSGTTDYSYHKLNYNAKLQRYFDSHQNDFSGSSLPKTGDSGNAYREEYYMKFATTAPLPLFEKWNRPGTCCHGLGYPPRLSMSVLDQHTKDMEKQLSEKSRKFPRFKSSQTSKDMQRKNQKDHIARCNAIYQPTKKEADAKIQPKHTLKGLKNIIPSAFIPVTNNLAPYDPQPSTSTVPRMSIYSPFRPVAKPVTPYQPIMGQYGKRSNGFGSPPTTTMDLSGLRRVAPIARVEVIVSNPELAQPDKEAEKSFNDEAYTIDEECTDSTFYSLISGTDSVSGSEPMLELPQTEAAPTGYFYMQKTAEKANKTIQPWQSDPKHTLKGLKNRNPSAVIQVTNNLAPSDPQPSTSTVPRMSIYSPFRPVAKPVTPYQPIMGQYGKRSNGFGSPPTTTMDLSGLRRAAPNTNVQIQPRQSK